MTTKEFKVVIAGEFGSGRTAFASRFTQAKADKQKVPALKTEIYPVKLYTSAGTVTLNLYDTQLHAKGGLPDQGFFRTADAALILYDTTKESSYDALEKWHDAFIAANTRKGAAPIPTFIVGTKIDGKRDVPVDRIEYARKKELPYREISAKGNYGVKELALDIVKALLGDGTQLTDEVELAKADAEIDTDKAEKDMKAYEAAAK